MAARARVVIVGGGFAGLCCARALGGTEVDVTLVDRSNYHLFQPLLYQVAMAGLSPAEIAVPIRSVLRRFRNVTVLLGSVRTIRLSEGVLELEDGDPLHFDHLVLAVGARTAYFGHDAWSARALGLKNLDDALKIRRAVLLAFEKAEREEDEALRRRYLTFVVIGGGPTGVELAGALAELARFVLARDFRRIAPGAARVILVEGGNEILESFGTGLAAEGRRQLEELGVELRMGKRVSDIDARGVHIGDELIEADVVLWAAGVGGEPIASALGVPLDRGGRVTVSPDCSIPGFPRHFAIGDIAAFPGPEGRPLPGLAPIAMQQGRATARNVLRLVRGEVTEPFVYRDKGTMATIGRSRAVAAAFGMKFAGFPAWLTWLFVHLMYLVTFRNRLLVLINWGWSWFTYKRGARLITGEPPAAPRA